MAGENVEPRSMLRSGGHPQGTHIVHDPALGYITKSTIASSEFDGGVADLAWAGAWGMNWQVNFDSESWSTQFVYGWNGDWSEHGALSNLCHEEQNKCIKHTPFKYAKDNINLDSVATQLKHLQDQINELKNGW